LLGMRIKPNPPTSQGPQHHELRARDLVTAPPTLGTPTAFVNVARSLFPKRRKRKPSDATLVKQAETATGRKASGITYHRDGKITVELDGGASSDEGEAATPINGNRWDEVLHGDR
jgi:hypothetical protein